MTGEYPGNGCKDHLHQKGGAHDAWKRLREMGLFSHQEGRWQGDTIAVLWQLIGGSRGDGARLFSKLQNKKARDNILRIYNWENVNWMLGKNFFAMRVVKH